LIKNPLTKKREKETNNNIKKEIQTRNFEQKVQDILTYQKIPKQRRR